MASAFEITPCDRAKVWEGGRNRYDLEVTRKAVEYRLAIANYGTMGGSGTPLRAYSEIHQTRGDQQGNGLQMSVVWPKLVLTNWRAILPVQENGRV